MNALNTSRFPGMGDLPGDSRHPNSPDYDSSGDEADESAMSELLTLPAFVSEAMGDCCDALVLAFVAGQPLEPILEAACRAKAESDLEDSQELFGAARDDARDRVVRTWRAYQSKYGPHPAAALNAEYDAQVSA